jgi:hypothetical protein
LVHKTRTTRRYSSPLMVTNAIPAGRVEGRSEGACEALNQAELAKRLGVSRPYIRKLVTRGVIALKDGRIDFGRAVRAIEAAQDPARPRTRPEIVAPQPTQETESGEPATASYQAERTLKEKYAALHRKLEYERLCGQLIPVDEVVAAWEQLVSAFRVRCLALPFKLAPRLSLIHETRKIQDTLTAALSEALEDLSRFELARVSTARDSESRQRRKATTQAHTKPMGRRARRAVA